MLYTTNTIFYETGQKFHNIEDQGAVYVENSYTGPLTFDAATSMPTPTGEAIVGATEPSAVFLSRFFGGHSEGFWIHKVYYQGNLVGTFQMVDQEFAIPMVFDRIESVSMPSASDFLTTDHPTPSIPGPSVVLVFCAALVVFKKFLLN